MEILSIVAVPLKYRWKIFSFVNKEKALIINKQRW